MTDQPRTPRATVIPPGARVTVTWTNPNPQPFTHVHVQRRGKCEQCEAMSLWGYISDPQLCAHHTALAAYAALPWWRRAITRKPKP